MVLDPGLSFGTGQHATTGFCLRQLVAVRRGDLSQSFLDIGTGSGILAIAAAKLGYSPARAFDVDPEAVRVAKANARQNGVGRIVAVRRKDLTSVSKRAAKGFDVVCANLTADLLIGERWRIVSQLRSGGCLILSGILRTQFAAVRRAYSSAAFEVEGSKTEGDWRSGTFAKASD